MFIDLMLPGYGRLRRRFASRYELLRQGGLPHRAIHKRLKIAAKYQALGFIENDTEFFTEFERRYFRKVLKKIRILIPLQRPHMAVWPPDEAADDIFHACILIENAARGGLDRPLQPGVVHGITKRMRENLLSQKDLASTTSHALDLLEGRHRIFNKQQYRFTVKHFPV